MFRSNLHLCFLLLALLLGVCPTHAQTPTAIPPDAGMQSGVQVDNMSFLDENGKEIGMEVFNRLIETKKYRTDLVFKDGAMNIQLIKLKPGEKPDIGGFSVEQISEGSVPGVQMMSPDDLPEGMQMHPAAQTTESGLVKRFSHYGIDEYRLPNGLKVLLVEDPKAANFTVNITYKVGSRHEGYGEKGMAHLLEHLMFKGTPKHPDIPKELSDRGALPNGTTSTDRTNYYETLNATGDNLEWALDLEADRMVNSFIAEEDLASEFSVVRNEFEMRDRVSKAILFEKVVDAAFEWHNYGFSTIGNQSDIERVSIERLQAFYKKYYRPDNATLILTGKFDRATALELIQKKFGPIKNPPVPLEESYTIEPPQEGEKTVSLRRPSEMPHLMALYHAPAASHKDMVTLSALAALLTDDTFGPMRKALVRKQKITPGIGGYSMSAHDPSYIFFAMDVNKGVDLEKAEKAFKAELDHSEFRITQESLDLYKENDKNRFEAFLEEKGHFSTMLSETEALGDWRLFFITHQWTQNLTLEDLKRVQRKYLVPSNRTLGRLIPTDNAPKVVVDSAPLDPAKIDALAAEFAPTEADSSSDVAFDNTKDLFDYSAVNIYKHTQMGQFKNGMEYAYFQKQGGSKNVILEMQLQLGKDPQNYFNTGAIAAVTAGMLGRMTQQKNEKELAQYSSKIKSHIQVFSAMEMPHSVFVVLQTDAENIHKGVALMAEILSQPQFDQSLLEETIGLQKSQLTMMRDFFPDFDAMEEMAKIQDKTRKLPEGHPEKPRSMEEKFKALEAVKLSEVKKFYNTHYGLNAKSQLVVVGDIDFEQFKQTVETAFADLDQVAPFKDKPDPFIDYPPEEKVVSKEGKNATTICNIILNLDRQTDDFHFINVATHILGGGFLNSRLATKLRQEEGTSYSVRAEFSAPMMDPEEKFSFLKITAAYNPDNYQKVMDGIQGELARLIRDGVSQQEVDDAVQGIQEIRKNYYSQELNIPRILSSFIRDELDEAYFEKRKQLMENMTAEQVNAAIRKYIKPLDEWIRVSVGNIKP